MNIIGNTVGMGLPKPNLMQTDPEKGDFVKGKEEFLKQFDGSGLNGNTISPVAKTSNMTEKVGVDEEGKLWTRLITGCLHYADIAASGASTVTIPLSAISLADSHYNPTFGDKLVTNDGYLYEISGLNISSGTSYTAKLVCTLGCAPGNVGKSAYQYAQEGGFEGTEEEFAAKMAEEIPDVLPNPYPLTINGKSYNGSEAVDIQITGGTTSDNMLLGQTPITLLRDANVRLVGSGDYTYSVKGKTVADLTNMQVLSNGATLSEKEDYIELTTPNSTNWYDKYVVIKFDGLTVGTSYVLAIVGLGIDTSNKISNGYYQIRSGNNTELGRISAETAATNSVQFTATTTNIEVRCYAANDYYYNTGYRTARVKDIYLNEASNGTERTSVINETGTFTDSYVLGQLSKGIAINTTPSCEVYSVVGGYSESGSSSLAGKTIVCFGDSLFGMYTGDTSAPAFVAQKTGATVHNVGFSGCRMSEHPYASHNPFCMYALSDAIASGDWSAQDTNAANGSANFPEQLAILKGIDFAEVDAIVIHYGTNDFTGGSGVPLDNESNPKDCNTLCGALRYSVEKLLSVYPKMKIFVSLPAFRYWTADDGKVTYSDTYKNGIGKVLPDYVKALAETANEYNLPVIDCYYGLGVNKINASTFLADGVHHNVEGRKLLGEYIGAKLISDGDTFYGTGFDNGGSASIDVAAEVGQTIVVEEVDASGKPTKWKAAEYQQKICGSEEFVVLEETTVVPDGDGNMFISPLSVPSIGDVCKVTYNGTEYECEAMDGTAFVGMTAILLGNVSLAMGTGDTGEPFILVIAVAGENGGQLMPMDGSETFVLSIIAETVTKMPAKYIPDEVAAYAPHYIVCSRYDTDAEGNTIYKAFDSVTTVEAMIDAGRQVIAKIHREAGGTVYAQLAIDFTGDDGKRTLVFVTFLSMFTLTPQDDGSYLGKLANL